MQSKARRVRDLLRLYGRVNPYRYASLLTLAEVGLSGVNATKEDISCCAKRKAQRLSNLRCRPAR
jgi:hypothetical protein